nr:MAG: nonstructural protein [Microviridae sp.]
MFTNIYAIRDKRMQVFRTPFIENHDVLAIRSLTMAMHDPNLAVTAFPEDFALYEMGTFNDQTGVIVSFPEPNLVITAVQIKQNEFKRMQEEQNNLMNNSSINEHTIKADNCEGRGLPARK